MLSRLKRLAVLESQVKRCVSNITPTSRDFTRFTTDHSGSTFEGLKEGASWVSSLKFSSSAPKLSFCPPVRFCLEFCCRILLPRAAASRSSSFTGRKTRQKGCQQRAVPDPKCCWNKQLHGVDSRYHLVYQSAGRSGEKLQWCRNWDLSAAAAAAAAAVCCNGSWLVGSGRGCGTSPTSPTQPLHPLTCSPARACSRARGSPTTSQTQQRSPAPTVVMINDVSAVVTGHCCCHCDRRVLLGQIPGGKID